MKKEEKAINKVKRLLRRIGCPRWLHHFGPKKFVSWQLILGLLIKEVFRLSYRRAMKFLSEFYKIDLHWTTLQKFRKRVPLSLWQKLLSCTADNPIDIAAIDGTSLQRSNPSAHYLKRIDREKRTRKETRLPKRPNLNLLGIFFQLRKNTNNSPKTRPSIPVLEKVPRMVIIDTATDKNANTFLLPEEFKISQI